MADAKIEIKVGAVSFSGEGDGKWLSEQLDKVIEKLPELANVAPAEPENGGDKEHGTRTHHGKKSNVGTLASFLATKNAKNSKTRKFLATALWLHDSSGANRLATGDVKKALSQHNQGSVGNASQCLVQNNKQGFTAKDGAQFYVTPEGRTEIG
ncbi:MAG: hypothetical protein LAO09_18420 [Acidobacteriia bacterium]|nr:hypothetical protein [Terriglobia bacterium]